MGLKEAFESILNYGKAGKEPSGPPPASMVFLLREERFPKLEQLQQAAERAYGIRFSLDRNSRHCVYTQVFFTLMKVGPHTLSFMFYAKPYGSDSDVLGKSWRLRDQQKAWAEHTVFMAIDYAKGGIDFESRYALLARLSRELYDANCLGIYLPRERALVPDEKSVRDMFDRVISGRVVDVT
jgi:hypothetical protein